MSSSFSAAAVLSEGMGVEDFVFGFLDFEVVGLGRDSSGRVEVEAMDDERDLVEGASCNSSGT